MWSLCVPNWMTFLFIYYYCCRSRGNMATFYPRKIPWCGFGLGMHGGGGYTWCGWGHILLYIACCEFVTWSRSRYVIIPKSLQDSLECVLNRICSGLTRMCPSQNVFSYTMCSLVSHRQVFHSSKEAPRVCSLTRMRTRARICCLTKLCSLDIMRSLA